MHADRRTAKRESRTGGRRGVGAVGSAAPRMSAMCVFGVVQGRFKTLHFSYTA